MVMQSEAVDFVINKINTSTPSVEYGESSTADYEDNSLDTVHATVTDITITNVGSKIIMDYICDENTGNGNDIDSDLIYFDDYAINKNKWTSISKDDTKLIDSRQQIFVVVE